MSLRKHLGPAYTEYPAKQIGDYLGDKIVKLIMTVICCALWTGAYYVLIGIFNFNRMNFMENASEMTAMEMMTSEASLWVLLGTYLVIMFLVFRSRMGEKTVRKRAR